MGMFDNLLGSRNRPLTPQAGLLVAAISMVAVDGDIDDDELAIIRRLDGTGRTDAWDAALAAWKRSSVEECVDLSAKAMDSDQRLVALANLIDIAMADGFLAGAEKDLLERYVQAFEVEASKVGAIVDIIAIKNNKAVFTSS